jgi:protein-tyrosine phosphatase
VCTANQCRSPVAAAIFNSCVQESELNGWHAESAGTWATTDQAVEGRPLQLARTIGIDLSHHRTLSIDTINFTDYDYIVVMEKGHLESLMIEHPVEKRKINLATDLAEMAGSDIPDPLLFDNDSAVSILLDLQECIRRIHKRILLGEIQPCI